MRETGLKLGALDAEDLAVLSSHLQDAVLKVGDMTYRPAEQRFAAVVNRFDWMHGASRDKGPFRRRRSGLSFERVTGVKFRNIRRGADDAVLNLLAVSFEETDAPGGHIDLVFAGGGAVRLTVECIEGRLSDLGPEWETPSRPAHDLEDQPDEAG